MRKTQEGLEPVFRVEGVSKSFGGLGAVREVSLNIKRGEIYALIGPNGAGKTTLFNCVSGLLPVDRGRIYVNEIRTDGLTPYEIVSLGISRTFQSVRLFPSLSILENIEVAQFYRTRSRLRHIFLCLPSERAERRSVREKAERLLAELAGGQLYPRRFDYPDELSTGQQRMLEISRALVSDPELILLDEPTAGLSPVWVAEVVKLIRTIREQGRTIFLIEHNMPVVMEIADRVAVLNFGQKIAEGTPRAVRANPEVIAAYLG
jgi:ABC-type branched-subunit amino acid transport system ATPase component